MIQKVNRGDYKEANALSNLMFALQLLHYILISLIFTLIVS